MHTQGNDNSGDPIRGKNWPFPTSKVWFGQQHPPGYSNVAISSSPRTLCRLWIAGQESMHEARGSDTNKQPTIVWNERLPR